MKKILLLTTMFVSIATMSFGQLATATAPHNFAGEAWNPGINGTTNTTELCAACHIPHNGVTLNNTSGLLWSQLITSQTFTQYVSPGVLTGEANVNGSSKMCLSCHDDATSIHSSGTIDIGLGLGNVVGTDLSNDHPIGVQLVALAGNYKVPTNAKVFGTLQTVECASCHDVHADNISLANTNILRASMLTSQLCLDCHIK